MNETELIENLCSLLSHAAEVIRQQHEIIAMLKSEEENSPASDLSLLFEIETLVG